MTHEEINKAMTNMLTRRTLLLGTATMGLALSLGLPFATPALAAADAGAAVKFVQGLGDRAIGVLSKPGASKAEIQSTFTQLLEQNFDLQTIGRFVLGRYWNIANDAQRQEYMKLFQTMIVSVYAERFSQYAGETFKVGNAQPDGEKDAIVNSQVIRSNGPAVNVDWRLRSKDGSFRIIDVVVENVSMSLTQRSEFASVIESHGGDFNALLEALRDRIQKANAGVAQ
ncbi:ABC transporter substrate-binding protein [Nitrospirillum sp. BR 11752]|uniref:Phospholipid transport system substrate-binding protein n=1 Tax=Nitrospirillum amazonense TaxID=28077 RepID=A0A560GNB0_9PROT|nr:ABC transporter substrate-binding protein [Nitrospirillum amazonense]MEE3625488.1 ABC transporter substrate-binding protein [Nitrospirillum sp. BR 11752]TWB35159.1 phospholipid transport system substrate-binding protein [Nitrospirillum amazonense]